MNLWATREKSLRLLETELAVERQLMDQAFQQLEYLAQRLDALEPATAFSRCSALIAAKARCLAQACYSLALDALGQESGAIARVWMEATQLLTYIRLDPTRAEAVMAGKVPNAGAIAKQIDSPFMNLRRLWNVTASHIGFEPDAWLHLVDWRTEQIRTRPVLKARTLRTNIGDIFALLTQTIREAGLCLDDAEGLEEGIARQIDNLKKDGFNVFHPREDAASESG